MIQHSIEFSSVFVHFALLEIKVLAIIFPGSSRRVSKKKSTLSESREADGRSFIGETKQTTMEGSNSS